MLPLSNEDIAVIIKFCDEQCMCKDLSKRPRSYQLNHLRTHRHDEYVRDYLFAQGEKPRMSQDVNTFLVGYLRKKKESNESNVDSSRDTMSSGKDAKVSNESE